jgi:CRP/FNR family cyclic AMP-dependent transcriptional regulator
VETGRHAPLSPHQDVPRGKDSTANTRQARVASLLVDQLFNSAEKRLARVLLLLAHFGKDDKPEPVIAKISQETLAEMIGTTRSRVSFFMNKFRKLGFIDYNGELHVHSSLLNVVLHD